MRAAVPHAALTEDVTRSAATPERTISPPGASLHCLLLAASPHPVPGRGDRLLSVPVRARGRVPLVAGRMTDWRTIRRHSECATPRLLGCQ